MKNAIKAAFLIYLALAGGYWIGKTASEFGASDITAALSFGAISTAAIMLFISMWRD